MNANREILENKLEIFISKYAKNREVRRMLMKDFKDKNILQGEVLDILSLRTPVSILSEMTLLIFTQALYNATKEYALLPTKYFTAKEIEEGTNYYMDTPEIKQYPVIFKNPMFKINSDHYITYLTAQELEELYNRRVITYNTKTQRNLKQFHYRNNIIEKITINKTSVHDIGNKILNNSFIPNFITFNILQDGNEDFGIGNNNTLIVNAGQINILDGFHRSVGILYALKQNKDIDFKIGVNITNFDTDKARRFIVQEDKKNKISKTYIKSLDADNLSQMIVHKINDNPSCLLKGRINNLNTNECLVKFDMLMTVIEYTFNPATVRDMVVMAQFIIDELNKIIEHNPSLLKPNSVNEIFWIGCILCIYKIYSGHTKYDINTIIKILDEIEFENVKIFNKGYIKRLDNQINI